MTIDLTKQKFGFLTVLNLEHKDTRSRSYWLCKCDCGKECSVRSDNLRSLNTTSCGCMKGETHKKGIRTVEHQHLYMYKKGAEYRGYSFNLSDEYAISLMHKPCFYCGRFDNRKNYKLDEYFRLNGIDRVDNSQNYTENNCVPCCRSCNLRKKDFSIKDMKKILNFLGYSIKKEKYDTGSYRA